MPHLVLSTRALLDLERLEAYLSQYSILSAEAAIRTIRADFPLLTSHPRVGRLLPGKAETREWKVKFGRGAYRILYRLAGDAVFVVTIQHSRERRREM